MSDAEDLRLNNSSGSDDFEITKTPDHIEPPSGGSRRGIRIALGVAGVVALAAAGYFVRGRQPAPAPAAVASAPAPIVPEAPKTGGPLVEGEHIPLPPLPETDALVRQLVRRLSSHPQVLAWLATDRLIENFAVVTLNMSEGRTPVGHLRALAPRARFSVLQTEGGSVVDPKSYRRYDGFAEAVAGLDAAGTARLYLTLKPRITDAYRELGHPEGDFDRVLEAAIKPLLDVPSVDPDTPLQEKVLTYRFADPKVESLTPAQKQLLRMGPDNVRRVQDKLREIATELGLSV